MRDARCNNRSREHRRKSRDIRLFNFRIIYKIRRHVYINIAKEASFLSPTKLVICVIVCKDKKMKRTFTRQLCKAS